MLAYRFLYLEVKRKDDTTLESISMKACAYFDKAYWIGSAQKKQVAV
jgi:hypothetical protein